MSKDPDESRRLVWNRCLHYSGHGVSGVDNRGSWRDRPTESASHAGRRPHDRPGNAGLGVWDMTVLFTAWDYQVTAIELASVVLALLGIALGIVGTRWMWPPYFLSSLLYGWLFVQWHLYASAGMQVVFLAAAVWGWFTWGTEGVRVPGQLSARQRWLGAGGVVLAWVVLAPLLQMIGGVATWGDAFMLVGSIAAQLLMVLAKVEAWPIWVLVNLVGTGLYASQGLYFTASFYAILIVMALIGWRTWFQRTDCEAEDNDQVATQVVGAPQAPGHLVGDGTDAGSAR